MDGAEKLENRGVSQHHDFSVIYEYPVNPLKLAEQVGGRG